MMALHESRDSLYRRSLDASENFGEFIRSCLSQDRFYVVVAQTENDLVGYCLAACEERPPVFQERRFGEIYDLAVTAACRLQGIGAALLANVRAWFTARGIRRLEAKVAVSNEISTRFWRKMGFRAYVEAMSQEIK